MLTDFTHAAQLFVGQLGSSEGRIVSCAYLVKSLLRYLRTQDDAELYDTWDSGSLADKVAKYHGQAAQLTSLVRKCGLDKLHWRVEVAQQDAEEHCRGVRWLLRLASKWQQLPLLGRALLSGGGAVLLGLAWWPRIPWPRRAALDSVLFLLPLLGPVLLLKLTLRSRSHQATLRLMESNMLEPMQHFLASMPALERWFAGLGRLVRGPVNLPQLKQALEGAEHLDQACDTLVASIQRCQARVLALE
ncbi:hypothetical protein N2152v2_001134 [Parachlorella kessleri]